MTPCGPPRTAATRPSVRNLRERDRARRRWAGRDLRREAALRRLARPAGARAARRRGGRRPRAEPAAFPRDDRPGAALCGDHWVDAPDARGGGLGLFGGGGGAATAWRARLRWRVWGAIRVDAATHAVWRRADDRGAARWRPASPPTAGDTVWASAARAAAAAAATTTRRRAVSSARALPRGGGGGALRRRRRRRRRPPPAAQPVSPPAARPQTHLANARTDGGWSHEANGRRVQGQLEWARRTSSRSSPSRGACDASMRSAAEAAQPAAAAR